MSVTNDHISLFRQYNSMADQIAYLNRVKSGLKSNEVTRHGKIAGDIASHERAMEDISQELTADLGPEWAARCVEKVTRAPGHVSVLVDSQEFSEAVAHIALDDVNGVRFVVGSECFEVRRVVRGMDAEG